ncbi:MAG: glycine cleavage system aminomethyltransferase GcvT [Ferrimicrobium sp.]
MLQQTALYEDHIALGAKMTEFGGFSMPLSYPAGTLHEHRAVRTTSGVFDVSHLGTVEFMGPQAKAILQRTFTNDLDKIEPGRTQYTHLLAEDGSVIDDIIVWWIAPDRFHVMPNASNTKNVQRAIGGKDITTERVVLAVQGPRARACIASAFGDEVLVERNRLREVEIMGSLCVVAGTGYTGEPGMEITVPIERGGLVFRALIDAGCQPAGLGARDTLRLEAGLPLHGHELGAGITPLNANLGWVVAMDKGDFPGKQALLAQRQNGVDPILVGVSTGTRQPLRDGDTIYGSSTDPQAQALGRVSSGGFSPMRQEGIGLAFLHNPQGHETGLSLRRGDRVVTIKQVPYPFVPFGKETR